MPIGTNANRAGLKNACMETGNAFCYNTRSEVTDALMGTNSYTYAYDQISNRLQSAVAAGSGPSGETLYTANALNQSPITYQSNSLQPNSLSPSYDHQSRRIRKEVSAYNASTSNFEPVTCNLFLYDGWNPIRETISNQQSSSTNYYTWGLDHGFFF